MIKETRKKKGSSSSRLKKIINEKVARLADKTNKKNNDLIESINYAKLIQEAVLPERDRISKAFPNSFILYRPKDIVSGDFYWFG
ncbi:MAG: hypothetical protein H0V01_04785 [Bacteroidetes bacterium]|nr:hypothetical protein [Bacteroidota bacterium]HET6245954.1 hypothetical protein [Bacteroidia bacterium]